MKPHTYVVVYLFTVCVLPSESINILGKIKNFFHPTTTARPTTAVPILPDYESEAEHRTESSSILQTSTHSIREGDTYKPYKLTTTTSKNYFIDKENDEYDPGPTVSQLPTARSLYNVEDEDITGRPSSPENFPTIAPPDIYEVYPGMKKTPTTPQTTTSKNLYNEKNPNQPVEDVTRTEMKSTSSTTENSYYNQLQPTNTKKNEISGFEIQTTTYRSDSTNFNTVQPNKGETSTTSYNYNINEVTEKQNPESSYSNKNQLSDEDSIIVFPDNPCLNEVSQSGKGLNAKDCRISSVTTAGPMQNEKKAPVPVGDDGGRNIADGAVKNCGQGKKLDGKGKCKSIARK